MDEIGEARVRVQGIEPGISRQPEQVAIPEPIGRFEPIEGRVHLAESRVECREGDRLGLASQAKLLEFAEQADSATERGLAGAASRPQRAAGGEAWAAEASVMARMGKRAGVVNRRGNFHFP